MFILKKNKTKQKHRRKRRSSITGTEPDKRNHFRLVCRIPASVKIVRRNALGYMIPGEPQNSIICNISGGGVRLLANFNLDVNERLLITFKLNDDILILTGEIRVKLDDPGSEFRYQYGVMFTGMSRIDQDIVYKYLFQEQTFRVLAD